MVDTEGKILIGEDGLIKLAADGHGGIYESPVKIKNEFRIFVPLERCA